MEYSMQAAERRDMGMDPKFERFKEITSELHRLIGIDQIALADDQDGRWITDFVLDDVDVGITYSSVDNPDKAHLLCIFGEVEEFERCEAMLALMRLNFRLALAGNASFSINPVTNQVVLMASIDVERVDSQSILNSLVRLSEQAHSWRTGHFLDLATSGEDAYSLCSSGMRA
jgi:hypothetical protein